MSKITKSIYRVLFINQGKLYELYARSIYQGELYGFIEVEELIFGERSSVLVNPAEELKPTHGAGALPTSQAAASAPLYPPAHCPASR